MGMMLMKRTHRDTIRIMGLKFSAAHGVLAEEKTTPQPFEVDVEIKLDLTVPAGSDKLADTINYTRISTEVQDVIDGEHHCLIEKLAGLIIERISMLVSDGEITVRIRKPRATITIPFETVEVELKRNVKQ